MKSLRILSFVLLGLLLTQCYPDGPEYVDDLDLVYTNYDQDYNFSGKQTYAMPDKIMKVTDDLINGGNPSYVSAIYADPILARIDKNMTDYGWTKVGIDADPDVLLAPAAWEMTTITYDYWYYYDWWYGGYYPPGGWYYPYYTVSAYSTGTLLVSMVDPNELTPNDKARVVWVSAVNGLLEGSTAEFTARMTKAVDQAYKQSPYLKK